MSLRLCECIYTHSLSLTHTHTHTHTHTSLQEVCRSSPCFPHTELLRLPIGSSHLLVLNILSEQRGRFSRETQQCNSLLHRCQSEKHSCRFTPRGHLCASQPLLPGAQCTFKNDVYEHNYVPSTIYCIPCTPRTCDNMCVSMTY